MRQRHQPQPIGNKAITSSVDTGTTNDDDLGFSGNLEKSG